MGSDIPIPADPLNRKDQTMRYRPLGQTGLQVSALSFGCMRLADDPPLNAALLSRAIDLGINYFETTRSYLDGTCQHRVAPGIQGRTAGLIVSGKGPLTPDTTAFQFRREIERQLEILGLSRFRFYQVGWFSWGKMPHLLKRGGALDAIRRAKDEGLVQHLGFTGHDHPDNFVKCLETGLFDSITVPYSLINRSYEPTIRRAGELGVGVVAMCPVAGGILAGESAQLQQALGLAMPTPDMALRFVLANPHVSTACSGMSTLEMLEQNARTARDFDPVAGTHETMCAGLERLRQGLGESFCTECRYCMPCPRGVNIPLYLRVYRTWKCYGLEDTVRRTLPDMCPPSQRAANCDGCGTCETKCPNRLPIRETLRRLEALRIAGAAGARTPGAGWKAAGKRAAERRRTAARGRTAAGRRAGNPRTA